ncbi:MAG: hypothetical protein ABWY20_03250 [Mycobacterium sp.]
MSARDELADLLCREHLYYDTGSHLELSVDDAAAAILAAGYSKPRTITTVDELDALGRGATVLDVLGDVWTNDGDAENQWGSVTAGEPYGGPQWCGSSNILLAATVLYEGESK